MPQFFAFLRAINAGPPRVTRMSVLRQTFESLGFYGFTTSLARANVVFETRAKDVGPLEKRIERGLSQALGYSVPVFIRTHTELRTPLFSGLIPLAVYAQVRQAPHISKPAQGSARADWPRSVVT